MGVSFVSEICKVSRFGLVGILATLSHLCVSLFCNAIIGLEVQVANVTGFLLALGVSYAGHYHFSFRSGRSHRGALLRFLVVACVAFVVNLLLVEFLDRHAFLPDILQLAIGIGAMPFVTYVLHRFWVF